ncbi:MAG: hypothetical protein IT203_02650 [Fimbriimonadaceae bacterium]|nr:hypothetical protein [Fimbriimonadaceae bacterium]
MTDLHVKAVREEYRDKRPTQADFDAMVRRRRRELRHITEQFAGGQLNPDQWADRFDSILLAGHSRAWHLGRKLAGDLRDFNDDDRLMGLAAKDGDAEYLRSFLEAIKAGDARYVDESGRLRPDAIMNRANLYLGKMRGTSAEAFVAASDDAEQFDWVLGANERHCEDCPRIARLSPFEKSTMFTYPGSGDTECLGNCLCYVRRRSDRLTAFKPEGSVATRSQIGNHVAPVSDAIDNNTPYPMSAAVNDAVAAIDSVHIDGSLPVVYVHGIINTPDLGGYIDTANLEIAINHFGSSPRGTMVHELGHLIDLYGFGTPKKFSSAKSRLLKPWRDEIKKSKSLRRINAIACGRTVEVDGESIIPGEDLIQHAKYLQTWEELWARSYFQFIAKRSGQAELSTELAKLLKEDYQKLFLAQFDDEDFEGIEKAIESLFVDLGWIRND